MEKQLAKARNQNNEQIIADQAALIKELVGALDLLNETYLNAMDTAYCPSSEPHRRQMAAARRIHETALSRVPEEYRE